MNRSLLVTTVLAAALLLMTAPLAADEIYGTGPGCIGFLCFGFDVMTEQAQALRFTPGSDFALEQIGLWFMNNDFSGQFFGEVVLTIEGDLDAGGCSTPDGVVLEEIRFNITSVGWDPVLEQVQSVVQPALAADTPYWIVARSDAPIGQNPVWVSSEGFTGFMSASVFGDPDTWQCGGEGAVAGVHVGGRRTGHDYTLTVPPLTAGQPATLQVTGAAPSTTTYLAASVVGTGETFLPPLNVTIELANPRSGPPPLTTDGNGDGSWTVAIPASAAGKTLWFQSAQFDKRSTLVSVTVQ